MPLAGIEPALLAELDFEVERVYQFRHRGPCRRPDYSDRPFAVNLPQRSENGIAWMDA